MISSNNGEVEIVGSAVTIIKEWSFLSYEVFHTIFEEKSKEVRERKMREAIEFVIENDSRIRNTKESKND